MRERERKSRLQEAHRPHRHTDVGSLLKKKKKKQQTNKH